MSSRIAVLLFLTILVTFLVGCQTSGPGGGTAPLPPTVGPLTHNATFWPADPQTVYFSYHTSVPETAHTGGQDDLYFANPYSFQLELHYQALSVGFEIQENGTPIALLVARTNTDTGQSQRVPRGVPPADKSSYSIDIMNTCMGQTTLSQLPCASPGAILLLTISPPRLPAAPTAGQAFQYTLVEKGSGSFSSQTATTSLKAVYVAPGKCTISNWYVTPITGKLGDVITANFETDGCKKVTLTAGSDTLLVHLAPGYADHVMDFRKFGLPQELSILASVQAVDAMQRPALTRSTSIPVDPCSLGALGKATCPVNCTATPNDARCPANCTATSTDPRCVTQCPRTTDNPSGAFKGWSTGEICGLFVMPDQTIYGCTLAQAEMNYPPVYGCVYTATTGKPVGDCPSGAPLQDFDMCLSCTAPGSMGTTAEYATVKACSLDAAKQPAIDAHKPATCVFVHPGTCP